MLKTLHISQFTVFREADFEFSEGLNVIIGDNGTGKTHLLKLAYLLSRAWTDLSVKRRLVTPQSAETYLADRLAGLFRVADLGALIRHGHKNGARLRANVIGLIPMLKLPGAPPPGMAGQPESMSWDLQIQRSSDAAGTLKTSVLPAAVPDRAAMNSFMPRQVFIPSKEMVSLFKGLISLFERFKDFPLDATYRDLAVELSTLELNEPSPLLNEVTESLKTLLGGDLKLEDNDLIFVRTDGSKLLSQLMAEGHRKLALLVYLLRTGAIEQGSTLFWDEPEANLNPAALKLLAESLHLLAGRGVQVIIATHSLFLLRELEILQNAQQTTVLKPLPRYFGLGFKRGAVVVTQGHEIAEIDPIVALDESLRQSDRYLESAP